MELKHPTEREEEILSEANNVRRHIPVGQQGTFQEQNTLYKSDHLLLLLKIVPIDTSLYCGTVWRSLFLKIKIWDYVNEQNIEFADFFLWLFWKLYEKIQQRYWRFADVKGFCIDLQWRKSGQQELIITYLR